MKSTLKKLSYVGLLLLAVACQKEGSNASNANFNSDFAYETSERVSINLKASTSLGGATFELYTSDPEMGGKLFGKGTLDASGAFNSNFTLPSAVESIFIKSTYIGLPGNIDVAVENRNANYLFDTEPKKRGLKSGTGVKKSAQTVNNVVYTYLSSYDSEGVPHNLTTPDVVDASLLADVNTSFPEGAPVPTNNAQYLASTNDTELKLTALSDAWVTFVHEGAGYKNVLGFYTYPTNSPPATVSDIDSIKIMFPNSSFAGSGGGLYSGDKVLIGRFPANTSIGWVLFQNAWDGSSVNLNATKFYSRVDFNPEPLAADRQHNVTLYHQQRDLVLIGFEDIARNLSGCDQDFNDAIFYITTNPVTAIDKTNLPPVTANGNNDDDNDGVDNNSDDYPNDPDKAFDQYYPNSTEFASVAFEDLWPGMGDYDFNDLVMDVNYKFVTNASNQVLDMEMTFKVKHIGASHHNGFGVELPFAASIVSTAIGGNITDNLVTIGANGLESGQTKATVIVFDDAFDNTDNTIIVSITLSTPYSLSQLNQDGLNPFIFVDGDRGREVHLMNHTPTDLANPAFFGKSSDDSDPANGRYYVSEDNYPWAIEINNNYKAPTEKTHITQSYLKFNEWVNSGGGQFKDWYSTEDNGYRDITKLQ